MKPSFSSSLPVLSLLLGTLALVGCGGAVSFDNSTPPVANVAGPAVQGSIYGGHAPIQGAHVYLLQVGITGYGSAATSLLGSGTTTSPGGYALAPNSGDPNVPATAGYNGAEPQYVTSDASGAFSFTGAYACTPGYPVYVYAYGGNIGTTAGTATTTYTISKIVEAAGFGTVTYTVTISSPVSLTNGESVTIAGLTNAGGFGGVPYSDLNGTQTVAAATSNSTTFTFQAAAIDGLAGGGTFTGSHITSGTVAVTSSSTNAATNNNNIVQLATLGNCPASGATNFGGSSSSPITYIYLNEVSTVATAYTFQPFTLVTNNSAWDVGVPSPATHAQALLGIQNAASTAAQLYNIEGSSTNISTSGDGEGHLANTLTAAGNGIVPQATLDTLANILANCVDSVPTTVGTPTTQCSSLFRIATGNGETTGTPPIDTGTAAMNIARYPAGNSSSTNVDATYASDLYAFQTGTVPYVPDLNNAPHDWTIAINYPVSSSAYGFVSNPAFGLAESIEVDANGDIWVTGQTHDSIVRINSLGVIYPATAANDLGYIPGYVSIDGLNNAWTGNANSSSPIFEAGSNGVFTATYGTTNQFAKAYVNIADNSGNDYFFASTSGTGGNYEMFEYPVGSTSATVPTMYSISPSTFTAGDNIAHGALDANGNFWLTSESSEQIAKVSKTGVQDWVINTAAQQPEFVAIDNNGTGWIPGYEADVVYKVATGGTYTSLNSSGTGAAFVYPFGSAIDGNGNVWITNRCGPNNACGTYTNSRTLVELNGTGTNGTINNAISPPTNFLPEAQYPATATSYTAIMPDPLNIAIDPSGNIWITNYNSGGISAVTEIIGTAAPVVTPLAAAAGAVPSSLGAKP